MADNFSDFDPQQFTKEQIDRSQIQDWKKMQLEEEYKGKMAKSPSTKAKGEVKKASVKRPMKSNAQELIEKTELERLSPKETRELLRSVAGKKEKIEKQEKKEKETRRRSDIKYRKEAVKKIFKGAKGEKKAVKRREKGVTGVLGAFGIVPVKTKKTKGLTRAQIIKIIKRQQQGIRAQQPRQLRQPQRIRRLSNRKLREGYLSEIYKNRRAQQEQLNSDIEGVESFSHRQILQKLLRTQLKAKKDNLAHRRRLIERRNISRSSSMFQAHLNKLSPQENSINSLSMEDNILNPKMNIMKDTENSIHILRSNRPSILNTKQNNNDLAF